MDMDFLLKSTARSLYLSAKFMPKKKSKVFSCAYLICRAADSIADTEIIPLDKRLHLINIYPKLVETSDPDLLRELQSALPKKNNLHESERLLLKNLSVCLDAFNNLSSYHKEITLHVVNAVCKAMQWDLSYFPESESGLLKAAPNTARTQIYCEHMGGEPGVFWSKLILNRKNNDTFIQNGKKIGMALQITNILRDLAQDVKIGRIYLPLTDLTENNLMPQDLLEKKTYKKLKPVIFKWITWGVNNLAAAKDFMQEIPKYRFLDRASVAWPVIWSLDTLLLLASSKNILDKNKIEKIPKRTIYLTMLASPFYCLSDFVFNKIIDKKTALIKEQIKG